jgi:hypothetical protein
MISTPKNRMYLNELSSLINRKDKRSVRSWCLKNHLVVFKDDSGGFVMKQEFELVYNMPLILSLKAKYGEFWMDYYKLYENDELYKILDFPLLNKVKKTGYVPKGKLSSKLFGGSLK